VSGIITAIHIIVCLVLIIAVLLQSGKSADLAGAFGGMGSQTVFGPRGATPILAKVTTICAILFMVTSMGLWILSAKGSKSVIKGEEGVAEKPAVTETQKKETPPATEAKTQTKTENKSTTENKKESEKKN